MSYSKKELDKLAHSILRTARMNLIQDGFVRPVGLIFGTTGLQCIFPMTFTGLEEKRAIQAEFKALVLERRALAAVVVIEAWYRTPTSGQPVDLTRSIAEYPDRQECLVVEAVSPQARHIIVQVFEKAEAGNYQFKEPFEPSPEMSWSSEWLDGVWDQKSKGGEHGDHFN